MINFDMILKMSECRFSLYQMRKHMVSESAIPLVAYTTGYMYLIFPVLATVYLENYNLLGTSLLVGHRTSSGLLQFQKMELSLHP